MELKVGMYVRSLNGIVQIDKIQDNVMKDTKGYLHYGDFIKASYDIIDLIEVGDYVNGKRVDYILEGELIYFDNTYCGEDEFHIKLPIKSIVTKEQFESISYKVD